MEKGEACKQHQHFLTLSLFASDCSSLGFIQRPVQGKRPSDRE